MGDDRFINRPLSVALDLVRAVAALVVLVGHSVQVGLYSGYFPFSDMMQHDAVIVFFVLSGLVISSSVGDGRATLSSYAIARAARILPVSLPALAFALGAYLLAQYNGTPPPINPPAYDILTLRSFILPPLFLSENSFGLGPVWNPPYWSMCYEAWFYAIFAAASFLRGASRVIWIGIFALLAGPRVLMLLPIWLIGVGLASCGASSRASSLHGIFLMSIAVASFPLTSGVAVPVAEALIRVTPWELGYSRFILTDLLLGLGIALGFIGMRPLVTAGWSWFSRIERPIRYMAGLSFTLYLLHWPILCLLLTFGIGCGSSVAGFILALTAVVAFCAVVAAVTERRRNAMRALLAALFNQNSWRNSRVLHR